MNLEIADDRPAGSTKLPIIVRAMSRPTTPNVSRSVTG